MEAENPIIRLPPQESRRIARNRRPKLDDATSSVYQSEGAKMTRVPALRTIEHVEQAPGVC